jgi:hypothetical protein
MIVTTTKYKPQLMKLKQYKIIDGDILIYGRGKTIKNDDLFSLFEYCNLQQLKEDFTNKTIDNYLLNSWDVMYYFEVKKENGKEFILTFSVFEYEIFCKTLLIFLEIIYNS